MIQCFAPDCKHQSELLTCKFFSFPNKGKDKEEYHHWFRLLRYEAMLSNISFDIEEFVMFIHVLETR